MEELSSGTEMDENTGCAGPGSDTKKVLKSQVDRKRCNNESKQQAVAAENNQFVFQNIITESSNKDQCSSSPSPKRKKLSSKIENTFLYKIPDDKLRNFYKNQYYNFSLQEKKTEWDTIMIIPKHNAIINIEVKLGPKDQGDKLKLLENASDQTKQHFSLMQKLFGKMISKDWVFVRAACVPHLPIDEETTKPCVNCQQFILQDANDATTWLKQIIEQKLVSSDNHDQTEYENLVAELIYHISIKESRRFNQLISDPFTISTETEKAFTGKTDGISGESFIPKEMLTDQQLALIRKTERISGESSIPKNMQTDEQLALTGKTEGLSGDGNVPKNMLADEQLMLPEKIEELSEESNVPVYMLNNEQLQAVHSPAKFLIIDGEYGTGKTYVLKERAKKCAIDNSKDELFYIDLTALTHRTRDSFLKVESSVMDIIAVVDFDSYRNIKVITAKHLGIREISTQTKLIKALNSFLRDNHCDHLFIDEMIIGEIVFPDSIETMCINLKVIDEEREYLETEKAEWLETMKMNHNAVHVNLTKNMRNSQQIIHLAKALERGSTQQMSCSPDTNIMGNHNFYYRNIYDIELSLLAVAAVNKYFIHKPKESVVVLSRKGDTELFELLNKHFSSTTSVVIGIKEFIQKPEGLLVTSIEEFQGAQARNIIICNTDTNFFFEDFRNSILRTMSFAIILDNADNNELNSSGAIEDKNLHKFIYPDGKAPVCHHYHNEYKHNISALTMAILDKFKLLDHDESIAIITCQRISKDIIKEANAKEFLSLPKEEREIQVKKKIELENRELYEDIKRNISRNYPDISWSYYHNNYNERDLKDLVNKQKHVNYINMDDVSEILFYDYYKFLNAFKNAIVFADENIDHKHAAWGNYWELNYSKNETSIKVEQSNQSRNEYDKFCGNSIMFHQPMFAIVVHDGNLETFSKPKKSLNLIKDDDLHEYIHEEKTNIVTDTEKEYTPKEALMSVPELACVYAALILADDDVAITSEKMATILKASGVAFEPYWPGLFAKALESADLKALITNVGSGVGAAFAAGAAPATGAAADAPAAAAKEEKKVEEEEEEDDNMGFSLFD